MITRQSCSKEESQSISENSDIDSEASDLDDHTSYPSESDTSDISVYNDGDDIIIDLVPSKDGNIQWSRKPIPRRGRFSSQNIIKVTPGITRYASSGIRDIKSSFEAIFFSGIESEIIKMTNIEGLREYGNKWIILDKIMFQAYLGLLLLAGVYKSHGESTKSLWNKETGRNIFRATMSHETFSMISSVVRFDDKSSRDFRKRNDKLAAIRNVWDRWVDNLPRFFNPGEDVTIDEQLVSFRGRCPFKQYIPTKPAKYGIKIWTMCDSSTSYVLKAQVYTGKKKGESPERNQGMRVVSDLTYGLTGHNLTCDNFFTSYKLAQLLLKRKITMVGTIRKNKPELPKAMLCNEDLHSSAFYFTADTTVVNYVPKKRKSVILMSTLHNDAIISERNDKKPEIILYYNSTKGAVDTLDQCVSTYTCKRKTNRWPMVIFYNILDVSAYNSYILWIQINPDWNRKKLTKRRVYLEELGLSLISEYVNSRTYLPRWNESKNSLTNQSCSNEGKGRNKGTDKSAKRARCKICPSSNDNKTGIICKICGKHVCKAHVTYICQTCGH